MRAHVFLSARGHHLISVWRTGGEPWHPPPSVLLPAWLPFSSRPAPVPRPGASLCCCAPLVLRLCCGDGTSCPRQISVLPCTGRPCTGKTKGKQAGQHIAACTREELLEVDAVTALKVVARMHPARGACSPCEDKQAVRVSLLPPLRAELGQTGQGSSRSPPWVKGREPAALREGDELEDR
jgi:hypothetical protein